MAYSKATSGGNSMPAVEKDRESPSNLRINSSFEERKNFIMGVGHIGFT